MNLPLDTPQLAPPGAGLPWIELQIARQIFYWSSWSSTPKRSAELLENQRHKVLVLVNGCDPRDSRERVLIPRLPGLEDSSRFWSVYMTLDHLRIVNLAVAEVIRSLGAGLPLQGTVSTAAVKPDVNADESVVEAFDASCRLIRSHVQETPNLKTALRYSHPWFGPLDAAQWHFMSGFHMGLHHRQLELIVQKLSGKR